MTRPADHPANDAPASIERLGARELTVLAVLLVGTFVVFLNETAMNVALSSVMTDFNVDERAAQWLTTAFLLTMATVIPTTGWLLQRLSTRTAFVVAMSVFAAGTLLAGVAPAFGVLVAARVVQAAGTAVMMPLLMTTIMTIVPVSRRGSIMGNISIVMAVAPAVGPTLAGLLLQLGSWRYVFLVVLPIAIVVLVIGALRITDVSESGATRLDALSVVLAALGFGGTVYGLSQIGSDGGVGLMIGAFVVGLAGIGAFLGRQIALQRRDAALLDLRTFTHASFRTAVIIMAVAMMVLFGTIILFPLLLQKAFHLDPLYVGLMMLPGGLLMGLLGPFIGRAYDRVGPRALIIPGAFIVELVFVLLSSLTIDSPWWLFMAGHILLSVGLAFLFTPLFTIALGALPQQLYSHGSAVLGTVQQVAGAAGTAVFVTIMSVASAAFAQASETPEASFLDGARVAFAAAGVVWLIALVTTFFVRKPEDAEGGAHGHGGDPHGNAGEIVDTAAIAVAAAVCDTAIDSSTLDDIRHDPHARAGRRDRRVDAAGAEASEA